MQTGHCFSQKLSLPLTPCMFLVSASQSIPTSHNSKESTSNKDSSKDSSIFREQLVSKDNVVIECTKSKSQKAQTGASQLEETTGPTTSAGMSWKRGEISGEVVSREGQSRQ